MAKKDFIIVGQGLAGSVLAYLLWKKGKKVVIIDRKTDDEWTSSRIAAGVISPITGWRFVKSWRIDEFLPAARAVYRGIETDLNIKIWHDRRLIRTIRNAEEQNNFQLRRAFVDYQPYISEAAPSVSKAFHPSDFGFLELTNAAQVNVPLLVECFQKFFRKNNLFETDDFDFHKLKLSDNTVFYKNQIGRAHV